MYFLSALRKQEHSVVLDENLSDFVSFDSQPYPIRLGNFAKRILAT